MWQKARLARDHFGHLGGRELYVEVGPPHKCDITGTTPAYRTNIIDQEIGICLTYGRPKDRHVNSNFVELLPEFVENVDYIDWDDFNG